MHEKRLDNLWVWRFSSCEKKKAYANEKIAASMAGHQRKISGHPNIRPYACSFCPNWHIGHTRSETPNGPKLYCATCDKKIPQSQWDPHYKKLHLDKPRNT